LASFLDASGRFQINRLERGNWAVLEFHVARAGAILDGFALWEIVLSRCESVTMEWVTIDWASVLAAVWANCGPLEFNAAEGVGLCSCGLMLGMLCGPAILEFLIPFDSLIVWFIFSIVIFYFYFFKKKKNRTSWARCFKE